jgi:hypothetical protein
MEGFFGTSDAYSHGFASVGIEAREVVHNWWPLQRRWLSEHSRLSRWLLLRPYPSHRTQQYLDDALEHVLRAQIADFDPDVVYVQNLWSPSTTLLEDLRKEGRFVAGQIASPAPPDERMRQFDLVITSFPHFVERFRSIGVDTEYLPLAFDARVLQRLRALGVDPVPAASRPYAIAFVGSLDPRSHGAGTAQLERVSRRVDLAVWGYGADALPADSNLRKAWRGEAWGLDMYATLARSRIVVNRHIDVAEGWANNMRLFEATGSGAMLLTESAPNLAELFEPGREVVAYTDEDDLVDKVEHYLADDAARLSVAVAGQRKTLDEHNYVRRIGELAQILQRRTG